MEVRRYESVVIFNPRLSEVQLKEEIKKVEGLLEKSNVTLSGVDSAGKKELAFEFKNSGSVILSLSITRLLTMRLLTSCIPPYG